MKLNLILVFIVAYAINSIDATMPSYIDVCKLSDPNFKSCGVASGQKAIATLFDGDKALKIPKLDPMLLKKVSLDSGNLKLNFIDANVYGIKKGIVKKVDIDSTGAKWNLALLVPTLTILTNYDVDGKILILPITGSGAANYTFIDILFEMDIDLEKFEKDGAKYGKIKKSSTSYTASKLLIQMENLFGGDPALAGEMLIFLNENWEEVNKELQFAISEAINAIVSALLNNILSTVPFDEILPP